ncbi:hypothetical protein [Clostridium estertheticum]|uniref:Uncharacterized protein n=1 Tax=Clostridium estertheticum TaxID=238834 RepID=A0A7Y3SYF1_9CLOT|nr:hypothetical protein [Clostridium estertheticum]NNU77678.1 hypothetical protein [Clostridium estertheticum]WBL48026.1 hypothetical protein LOR37_05060 [Clostridium estertheticum]
MINQDLILSEGNNINIATFKKGTVVDSAGVDEHMYSFDPAHSKTHN